MSHNSAAVTRDHAVTAGPAAFAEPANAATDIALTIDSNLLSKRTSDSSGLAPDAPLSVVVIAGNDFVRRGVEAVLLALPEVGTVRGCADPAGVPDVLRGDVAADVVIVTADETSWLDGLHQAIWEREAAVLVMLEQAAPQDLPDYGAMPVHGFVCQPHLTETSLHDALMRCRRGEFPIPPELARSLVARPSRPGPRERAGPASLTSRERQALTLLVGGLSNKEIARELSISSHGAKRLVTSVMLKLDTPNRTAAAVVAIRAGLLDAA